jgi:peroxiredoxin Q/BCP
MLLALAGAARAEESTKPTVPVVPPTTREAPISPVPQESHITSQVYVGEPAPDFELDGSQGRPVRLAHLKGYWVLLVFADRRADLEPLNEIEPDLRHLGVRPYGVCADKAYGLKSYADRQRLPVVLLSDVTGEISQVYGLYDTRMRLVRPGFTLIDPHGVVRMALLGQKIHFDEMLGLVKSAVTGS